VPEDPKDLAEDYQLTDEDVAALSNELGVNPDDLPKPKPAPEATDTAGDEDKEGDEAPIEDKPDATPDDAGEGGEAEDDEDVAPIEDKPPVDEALTLADLQQLGIGEFKTIEDARASLKNLRTVLSRRDEDAAFGRYLRSRGMDPRQVESLLSSDRPQTPESKPKPSRPEWDPAWERMVKPRLDEDTGQQIGWDGPREVVEKVEAFHAHQQQLWQRVYLGDRTAMKEVFADVIRDEAQSLIRQQQADTATERFLEKHFDFLNQHDTEFYALLDQGVSPEFAVEHLRLVHGQAKPANEDKPKPPKADARVEDLRKLRKKASKGGLPPAPPANPDDDELDLSNLDGEQIARIAAKRAGIDLSSFED